MFRFETLNKKLVFWIDVWIDVWTDICGLYHCTSVKIILSALEAFQLNAADNTCRGKLY